MLPEQNWHTLEPQQALQALACSGEGLSSSEAQARLDAYGENALPTPQGVSLLRRFLAQFNNPLIFVLLGATLATTLLGHLVDAAVILGMVLIMAVIGTVQEGRAHKALLGIRRMLSHQASVYRDGQLLPLPARQLVPGDIVSLQSGDRVPADLRLLDARELRIDESALTGESTTVNKTTTVVADNAPLAERTCMGYSGTFVTYGRGKGVVIATGISSEIGQIAALTESIGPEETPLMRQMSGLSRVLSALIVAIAVFTFGFGVLVRDLAAGTMFVTAVALAVAAIPEGLPAIITITLAIGVQRMAARNSIIRRLPGVETLGAVTVICSDKTGTLTHNEMMVRSVQLAGERLEVNGTGYDPHGEFLSEGRLAVTDDMPELMDLARIATLCNDARLNDGEQWTLHGDPTEGALLAMAMKAGLQPADVAADYPRTDAIPFESSHQLMATLHHDHSGRAWIMVKGAPEKLLALCQHQRTGDTSAPIDKDWWQQQVHALGEQGHRTLALAMREASPEQTRLSHQDLSSDLQLVGIVGISDPPRADAISAVAACREAGIRVKMVTGDLPATARAIAGWFKLNTARTLTGQELDALDEDGLRQAVQEVDVYARTSPEQKLRLVTALQQQREVVAMTGDGVNDAPALRQADIGVAMGLRGTEVAREAADMVLTDDNFTSIAEAVREGRTVYDNIKKSILFMLPTGLAEAFVIVLATLGGLTLPLIAVQILWINMITAVTLGIALAFEPPEQNVMARPPRPTDASTFSGHLGWRVAFVSLIMVSGTLLQFFWTLQNGHSIEVARTVTVNTVVLFEAFYLLSSRFLLQPVLSRDGLTGNPWVMLTIALTVLFQLLYTYQPGMQFLFSSASLPWSAWPGIILTASSILVMVEIEKLFLRLSLARQHAGA